jgi:hypothetical protein
MFESSPFEAHADASGISLVLEHPEEESSRKSVHMRIHFELVADILSELAQSIDRVRSTASRIEAILPNL